MLFEAARHSVAHVVPRLTRRFTGQHSAGAPFDFLRPRSLNRGRILGRVVVKAGQ